MRRLMVLLAVVALGLAPKALAGQGVAYRSHSERVGAVRIVALMRAPSLAARLPDRPATLPALPFLIWRPQTARWPILRLRLTERLVLRVTSDWIASGTIGTLDIGLRF